MNIRVPILICLAFVFLVLMMTGFSETKGSERKPQKNQGNSYRSPFRYIIVSNDVRNDGLGPEDAQRSVSILLDEKAFSELTLAELFKLLSKRYPDPKWLNVWLYTSLEQISTPEEKDTSAEISEPNSNRESDKHRWAFYVRKVDGRESYRYNTNPPTNRTKTVILK